MKTLLAVGCSLTDEKFESMAHPELDCSWPKWPEIVGKKLGYNVVNLGESGNSNDAIFKSAQDYIIDHKVDMICALWTQGHRLNIHDMSNINWNATYNSKSLYSDGSTSSYPGKIEPKDPFTIKTMKIFNLEKFTDIVEKKWIRLIHEHLRNIFMLNQFSRYNNIPIYHMQGASSFIPEIEGVALSRKRHIKYLQAFVDSKYFNILDKQTNIYGWPFYQELGGFAIDQIFKQDGPDQDILSDKDKHPNAHGHEVIANEYFELIESDEIYYKTVDPINSSH